MLIDHYLNLISIAAEKGKAPTRILLLRDGDIGWAGLEGVELDAEQAKAVIAEFDNHGADIPIDYHHTSSKVEDGTAPKAPAAGWIKRLEYVEGEGLYAADIEWTPDAKAEIESKQYKYLSPVILMRKGTREIFELHSVALTNRPRTIDAWELLEAAQKLTKEQDTMGKDDNKAALEALQAAMKETIAGLRLSAQSEDGLSGPAITDDMKAIADLITALQGAGVTIDTQASLAEVLTAAIEFVGGASDNMPEDEGEDKATDAEKTEMAVKAANYDKLAAEVKTLREQIETQEAEKTKARIDGLIAEMVKANKLNPNDEKAMKSARALAEKDEEAFASLFASIEPYGHAESVVKGKGTDATARGRLIAQAGREYDTDPKIAFGADKEHYINAALQIEDMAPMSAVELAAVKGA